MADEPPSQEEAARDDSAATMLQGSVRRRNAKQELSQRRQVRDDGAATMLQGSVRRRNARQEVQQRRQVRDDGMATLLQGAERRRRAKLEMNGRRRKRDDGAATMLQASERRRTARLDMQRRRQARDEQAVTRLQAALRGRTGRVEAKKVKDAQKPKEQPARCECRAISSFTAQNDNEMSLNKNERVYCDRKDLDDADGWLLAKKVDGTKDGYVPCGYLQIVGEESEDYTGISGEDSYRDDFSQQKSEVYGDDFSKEKSNEDETYGDDFVADEAPQEESDEALAARGLKRCVAVHAFNADGETELSVTKGEALLVPIADLAEGADGWVYATAVEGGREGYLPHTYVRPVGGSLASVAEEDPSENYDDDSVEAEEVSD